MQKYHLKILNNSFIFFYPVCSYSLDVELGEEQEDKDGCWSMKIVEHENCNPFHDFNAQVNSTLLQSKKNVRCRYLLF